ncbi:Serine/threonine kinase MPS1 [Entomophthora muscae]|uniref:Serine/threonine kinase MPS1 n=1 Tax=Entomophthora muscae TaxID=34485 RepID=A0ACC2UI53_9FUNG|nr:Serine/threonine kinase MPS1 [Entomophthora muscae]
MSTQVLDELCSFSSDASDYKSPSLSPLDPEFSPPAPLPFIDPARNNNRPKPEEGPSLHHSNEAMDTEEPYHQKLESPSFTKPLNQAFVNHKSTLFLKNKILTSENSRVKREIGSYNKGSSISASSQKHPQCQQLTPKATTCLDSNFVENHLAPMLTSMPMHTPGKYPLPRTAFLGTPAPLPTSMATLQKPRIQKPIHAPTAGKAGHTLAQSTPRVQPTPRKDPLPPSSHLERRTLYKAPESNIPRRVAPFKHYIPAESQPASARQRIQQPSEGEPTDIKKPFQMRIDAFFIEGQAYYLTARVGKGGTSSVVRALDKNYQMCAIKVISLKEKGEEKLAYILNEIRILRLLSSCQWIIQLYHVEINTKAAYLAMELGDINFEGLIRSQEQTYIDMDFIRLYWRHMLRAVQAIHAHHIVHTDLKPENFVLAKGILKLIDFGIARAIPKGSTSVIVDEEIGTIEYMAPEAIRKLSPSFSSEPASIKVTDLSPHLII